MKNHIKTLTVSFIVCLTIALQAEEQPTIVDAAVASPQFSTLVAAVVKAELVEVLDGHRQFTVFAPDNDAFDDAAELVLGAGNTGIDLVNALDKDNLTDILLYHVAPGERFSDDVVTAERIRTISKQFLFVEGATLVGNASSADIDLNGTDIDVKNGVIHTIEFVLLP